MKPRRKFGFLKITAYVLAGIFSFYVLLGFWGVPLILKWAIKNKGPAFLTRPLNVRAIDFNPFLYRLRIHNFVIEDVNKTALFGFDLLDVDLSFLNLFKKTVRFERIVLDGFYVKAILSPEGRLNLLELLPKEKSAAPPKIPATPPAALKTTGASRNPPSGKTSSNPQNQPLPVVVIDSFQIKGGNIFVEDETIQHPFKHAFRDINIHLEHLSTRPQGQGEVGVVIYLGKNGTIQVSGDVNVEPLGVRMKLTLKDIALSAIQPYLDNYVKARLQNGRFNLDGEIRYDGSPQSPEVLTFNGSVDIARFNFVDARDQESLLAWRNLHVGPVDFRLSQKTVTIGQFAFEQLAARLVLEDGGINVQKILLPPAVKSEPKGAVIPPEKTTLPPATPGAAGDKGADFDGQHSIAGLARGSGHGQVAPDRASLDASLGEFLIQEGQVTFIDKTVTPQFRTTVDAIEARVKGISTRRDAPIEVTLTGDFDKTGKMELSSRLQPQTSPLNLEMDFKLNNYVMSILTPYVGKYTGRAVSDGKLDLKIDYRVNNNGLKASHKVLIQKFGFGSKVESRDALNLPFSLAVSLLEDPQGRINISLPVSGDITDPKFHYGQLVGKTLMNFFLKIVTKPFAFLVASLGLEAGEEEFGYIRFSPGKAVLSQPEQEKLGKLIKGLQERPRLLLEIHGPYDPQADWLAIKTAAFEKEYQKLRSESRRAEVRVLEQLYERHFGIRALWRLASSFQNQKNIPSAEREARLAKEIRRQLIDNAPVDKSALDQLARERSQTVYDFFMQAEFDPRRVKIGENKVAQSSLDFIPLELALTVFE